MAAERVSVVIPTHGRPERLKRAVLSATSQTHPAHEVIVVQDGHQPEATAMLESLADPRIRIEVIEPAGGAPRARNRGVDAATGDWVALLDDDDEWLATKLESQLALAAADGGENVYSTRVLASSPHGSYVWPRRLPVPGTPISEYLFCRNGVFSGETLVATPTLLARRELFVANPFTPSLRRHQEWDWLLRVAKEGAEVRTVPEPLTHISIEQSSGISASTSWIDSLSWARDRRAMLTPTAYAAFVLVHVAPEAAAASAWSALPTLLREAFQNGKVRPIDLALFACFWVVPRGLRRRTRASATAA